jgi:hypothetical protein
MKRFALLIEASAVPGEVKLPGASVDVDNYYKWLYSQSGGDWYGGEIEVLRTPSISEVKKAMQKPGRVDYAFVTFSGHGYHAKELNETKICLRDGQMMARELWPDTDRATLVIDACRNVIAEFRAEEYLLSKALVENYRKAAAVRDYRKEFDTLVGQAEKGAEFLFSCDLDESAAESEHSGGVFSRLLVESGNAFANRHSPSDWFTVRNAFEVAGPRTTEINRTQHPKFAPGRRLVHFPFAV